MTTENNTEGASGGESGGETVMDAINEALGLGSEQPEAESGSEEHAEGAEGEGAEGAESAESEGAEGSEGEGAGEPVAPPVQPPYAELVGEAAKLGISKHHPNGHIKSAVELQAEIAAKQAGTKTDGKPGEKKDGKEPDPVNDPIEKSLNPATQQRIRTLIDRTKDAEGRAAEAQQNFDYMVNGLQAVGATPEQYGETLSFLALFNSNDLAQQGQALDILEGMADKLATLLGRERKVADPLANHADLKAEVQAGKLTPQRAAEIGRMRNQGAFRQELTTAANNQQQTQLQAQQEHDQAKTDLNALEAALQASDPLYARKKALIIPSLKVAFRQIPPRQWKQVFEQAYRGVQVPVIKPKVPVQQPMRAGKNPAGSGANASGGTGMANGGPASMFEAMWGYSPKT